MDLILLFVALGIILFGAELFTNGIEWFGHRLNLAEGAVGSVLAAVATAMPETLIPVIAIVGPAIFGGGSPHSAEIGVGAILGAPFMLSTLAMFVTGVAIVIFARNGRRGTQLNLNVRVLGRDVVFFLRQVEHDRHRKRIPAARTGRPTVGDRCCARHPVRRLRPSALQ